MIVDCHTHLWAGVEQLGRSATFMLRRAGALEDCLANPAEHTQAARCVDRTLVFACRCTATGVHVPNDYVAQYAASSNGKMLAVAAVDPSDGVDAGEVEAMLSRREVAGLTLDPAGGNFHPADSRVMPLYEAAEALGKCVFFNHGSALATAGRMEYARPSLLEEIALEWPKLTMVIASMGQPWVAECVALLGRRERVFADIASLIRRPWQAYQAWGRRISATSWTRFCSAAIFPSARRRRRSSPSTASTKSRRGRTCRPCRGRPCGRSSKGGR